MAQPYDLQVRFKNLFRSLGEPHYGKWESCGVYVLDKEEAQIWVDECKDEPFTESRAVPCALVV